MVKSEAGISPWSESRQGLHRGHSNIWWHAMGGNVRSKRWFCCQKPLLGSRHHCGDYSGKVCVAKLTLSIQKESKLESNHFWRRKWIYLRTLQSTRTDSWRGFLYTWPNKKSIVPDALKVKSCDTTGNTWKVWVLSCQVPRAARLGDFIDWSGKRESGFVVEI